MKKIFSKFKGNYFVFMICLIAVVGTAVSFTSKYVKDAQLKNLALSTPSNYVEPAKEEIPIAKTETKVKKAEEKQAVTKSKMEENNPVRESTNIEVKEFKIIKPVEGEVLNAFSKDTLIYSKTFEDYRVHKGIDLAAERSSAVKAVFDGVVEDVYADPLEGITIVINHNNTYKSVYKNLSTEKMVKKGEVVKQGQAISGVGETAVFEANEESHIHFELIKENEYIDPTKLFI